MQVTNFGRFEEVENGYDFENEDGQRWIDDLRPTLTSWDERGKMIDAVYGQWANVDDEGRVTAVTSDPSTLMPAGKTVLGIDAGEGEIEVGMIFDGEGFKERPPEPEAPAEPTGEQMKLALKQAGLSDDDVQTLSEIALKIKV